MSGGAKGAKRPLGRPLDGEVRPQRSRAYSTLNSYHVSNQTDGADGESGVHLIFNVASTAASSSTFWPELLFTLTVPTCPVASSSNRSVVRTGLNCKMDRACIGYTGEGLSHFRSGAPFEEIVLFAADSCWLDVEQATTVRAAMRRIEMRISGA
jgi:hypothetical protein